MIISDVRVLGGEKMEDYRAYVIGPDGHVRDRVDFSCRDDEAAKEQVKQLVAEHDIELWRLDRKISPYSTPSRSGGPYQAE